MYFSNPVEANSVESWPKDEVDERLESLQEGHPCVLRKGQAYATKDGMRRQLCFCHRGPKKTGVIPTSTSIGHQW